MGLELENLLEQCSFSPHAGRDLVCGVSGGPDSAALLALSCRFASGSGSAVTAVHVDHGIRADGSAEAAHVAALCDQVGAELRVVRLELTDGPNLQARAREARHAALGPDALLGHTADDQAETVLAQLMRGGSVDALAGMRADRRPLLGLRRSDTERICELVGYEPVRDPSNTDRRYLRTRVRHELIPLLCDIAGRDVVPLLARSAELAAADSELLDAMAADVDPTNANELAAAPVALARRAIRAWLRTPHPRRHPPDAAAVERVLDVARGAHRATEVGGGRRVSRSAGELRIEADDGHHGGQTG
ncbi:tRNA lysidine(34) synthetase TilS [Candidatus Poriferisodalis sp.]|uniref:tRNA lysidine(34) synthetase TilS n=1 Tax=Candidatus Poriferisodalis sp. TaxID=3101277 RepID=UPI003D0A3849